MLGLVATFILLPLCLAEGYANLALTSGVGLTACLLLACFTVLRLLDGSYALGGAFYAKAPLKPLALSAAKGFGEVLNTKVTVLLALFGMAYMNHGMAPGTYQELRFGEDESVGGQLRRYRKVTGLAFLLAMAAGAVIMTAGFLTFGTASQGFLLANYATTMRSRRSPGSASW